MNRFGNSRRLHAAPVFSLVVCIVMVFLFKGFLNSLSSQTVQQQRRQLESALNRGILTCYALEGQYPESLSYLMEHYPIQYDHSLFFVDYRIQGANFFPDVTILERRIP